MGGKRYHAETRTETRAPARSAQVGSDVLVPLLQSGVTGVGGSVIVGLLFGWDYAPATGALVFVAAWLFLLSQHRLLMWSLETKIGRDLDGDSSIGRPLPDPPVMSINAARARDMQKDRVQTLKRDAILRLAVMVDERQRQNRGAGQKALRIYSDHILGEYGALVKPSFDDFHRECGRLFVDNGLARADGTGWTLDASPEDVREALRAD